VFIKIINLKVLEISNHILGTFESKGSLPVHPLSTDFVSDIWTDTFCRLYKQNVEEVAVQYITLRKYLLVNTHAERIPKTKYTTSHLITYIIT
jgi:hypothetical protein